MFSPQKPERVGRELRKYESYSQFDIFANKTTYQRVGWTSVYHFKRCRQKKKSKSRRLLVKTSYKFCYLKFINIIKLYKLTRKTCYITWADQISVFIAILTNNLIICLKKFLATSVSYFASEATKFIWFYCSYARFHALIWNETFFVVYF